MDKIQPLFSHYEILYEGVSSSTVSLLEELLEKAKSGEISALAVTYIEPNNAVGKAYCSGNKGLLALLGAVSLLKNYLSKLHDQVVC
jgi:hypothetical protein